MDRTGHRSELGAAGADVVEDLGEVTVDTPLHSICDLLDALSRREEIRSRLDGVTLAVFLDYDGTLTPTVERPEDARLPEAVRSTVERLASRRERRGPVRVGSRDLVVEMRPGAELAWPLDSTNS